VQKTSFIYIVNIYRRENNLHENLKFLQILFTLSMKHAIQETKILKKLRNMNRGEHGFFFKPVACGC